MLQEYFTGSYMKSYVKAVFKSRKRFNQANFAEFVNYIIASDLALWDIETSDNVMSFCCSPKDYYLAAKIAGKFNARTEVVKKRGIYFKLRKYNNRYGLLAGMLAFFAIITVMSNYVWDIKVIGNVNLTERQVRETVSRFGVKTGVNVLSIKPSEAEIKTLIALPELSWINIETSGSRVNVKLSERDINAKPQVPLDVPCNVISSSDGVIEEIKVYGGTASVRKGDAVLAGEILVSGIVTDTSGNVTVRHANADIIARCSDTAEFFSPYTAKKTRQNGVETRKKYLELFGNDYPLFIFSETPDTARYREEYIRPSILHFKLPFRIKTAVYEHYDTAEVTLAPDDVIQELNAIVDNHRRNFYSSAQILKENIEFYPLNNGITARYTVEYLKNVAELRMIHQ
jgi:similar to stage IV sporulation protein